MLIVDAHEDIAWNALTFGRDYTQSALAIRACEAGASTPQHNGNTLLGCAEWLLGHVGVIFSTLFVAPERHRSGPWDTQCYHNARHAYELVNAQLDFYHRLADEHEWVTLISDCATLDEVVASWSDEKPLTERLVGLVPLMEGADAIFEPSQAEDWYVRGVRIVGLAWEQTYYAGGTHEPGPLTSAGYELLETMTNLRMILDLSHMAEEAYYQALECYEGVVIASHSNPRRFTPTSRGLSDQMIASLAERGGVVGVVPYNLFLKPGWRKGDRKEAVTLYDLAAAIDHVCQVVGNAEHVGIGSDFDGGFGVEHVPVGIDTIADLHKISDILAERGYESAHVANILSGNWLRALREAL